MCYHSNKLDVHYLHHIGSQDLQITPLTERKQRKVIVTGVQLHLLGSTTWVSLHMATPAPWELEIGRGHHKLVHTLRSGKGNYTLSRGNVTEPKTMTTNSSLAAKHTVWCRW